jgi:hypothetical protein
MPTPTTPHKPHPFLAETTPLDSYLLLPSPAFLVCLSGASEGRFSVQEADGGVDYGRETL